MIKNKVFELNKLKSQVSIWKKKGFRIVFTNGCFDILHLGHVTYLELAKTKGDILIVGINSDNSVRRLGKRDSRPLQSEYSRSHIVASLQSVDATIIFGEDTPINLIKTLMPHTLVKGGDYTIDTIVGASEVINNGGEVLTIPFVEGYSTSIIEDKILNA